MVNQPVIPKKLMQEWAKAKGIGPVDAFREGQRAKKMGPVSQAAVAAAWADLLKLYPKFDQGLQAAVKKANSAKDDAAALTALADVSRICMQYEKAIEKWRAKNDARNIVAGLVNRPMRDISIAAGKAEGEIKKPRNIA
jgi:hypothetical protein